MKVDFLIVGAGFAGSVLAERIATQLGKTCLVIDRRDHIAGNAYDYYDQAGILLHKYGPHYFRTNSQRVIEYLSQFTDWHQVEYEIRSWSGGQLWHFPINLNTFEQLIGRTATTAEMEAQLAEWRVQIERPKNSEEVIVSQVGWKLYEMFYKNYTRKQWNRDAKELDASVCGRIPIRTNRDNRYLSDRFQALPKDGYTRMFEKMLAHPKIEVRLKTDFRDARAQVQFDQIVYTGPIDEYFDHCYGPLPYRSLRFEPKTLAQEFFQPVVQVNYPNDHEFTRIVEMKHATGQKLGLTTIVHEFPQEFLPGSEPFYPIPAPDAKALYARYAERAAREKGVRFVGRLATYRYYNMDQIVGTALIEFEQFRKSTMAVTPAR